jgi:DNA repair exonuclease SbcCD ATPase subunit
MKLQIKDLYEFSQIVDNFEELFKVNTINGYKDILAIDITKKNSKFLIIKTKDDEIKCDEGHLLSNNNEWIKSGNFNVGDSILTKNGLQEIINIKESNYKTDLYDIQVDGEQYLANKGIVSHNSSIIDSFDYVFYNKVKGRKSKKVKLSSLPNRINGDMEVKVEFISNDNTKVNILRGYNPSKLSLWENDVENLRAGKSKIEEYIENYVGIDHDTFKGFISMSINDFKNFISLSNEEKKLLLDKLFNLEVINILNKILNDLIRENKKDIEVLDREISIISENIENINTSIENVKKSKKDNLTEKIQNIKEQIEKYREPFKSVKEKLELVKEKKSNISDQITNEKSPTCQADLNSGFHKGIKESFEDKKSELEKIQNEIKIKGKTLKQKESDLEKLFEKGQEKYNDINSTLKSLKREYDKLKLEQESEEDDVDLEEFYNSVKDLEKKLKHAEINKSSASDKTTYHKYLKSVFSDSGVKKTIIQNIIDPINIFIQENIQKMHLPFEVELDDTFTANITSLGEDIDIDTLSTGENKAINISIMLAYLKLIRTKRQINILFLDEVFSSIDVERINDVITLLRDLADHSKINIFLVHHSVLDSQHFDKILKIEKDVFSFIKEIN